MLSGYGNGGNFGYLARFSSDDALNLNGNGCISTLNASWAGLRLMEALNQLPVTKFGSSTDIRFQQKQQEERELRKMELTGIKSHLDINGAGTTILKRTSTITPDTKNTNSNPHGKVRQMFDERRRGAGIDKSYPLKPINAKGSNCEKSITMTSSLSRNGGPTTLFRKQQITTTNQSNNVEIKGSSNKIDNDFNENILNSTYKNIYSNNLEDEAFSDALLEVDDLHITMKLPNVGKLSLDDSKKRNDHQSSDRNNNRHMPPKLLTKTSATLKPVVQKKIPLHLNTAVTTKRIPSAGSRSSPAINKLHSTTPNRSPPIGKPEKSSIEPTHKMTTNVKPHLTQPSGTVGCKSCGRFFNADRITKHEEICNKSVTKKRKPFDTTKHRVKGTDAEKFLKKKPVNTKSIGSSFAKITTTDTSKKSNWRRKHEEFIAAIRAAKEVQAHLAKGGKLSDLPPPPPSENPDYIQCPHCQRRFNEAAATRHIPKCATMLHNKPKPSTSAKRK